MQKGTPEKNLYVAFVESQIALLVNHASAPAGSRPCDASAPAGSCHCDDLLRKALRALNIKAEYTESRAGATQMLLAETYELKFGERIDASLAALRELVAGIPVVENSGVDGECLFLFDVFGVYHEQRHRWGQEIQQEVCDAKDRQRRGCAASGATMLQRAARLLMQAVRAETGCDYIEVRSWVTYARENLDAATLRAVIFFLVGRRFLTLMKQNGIEAFVPVGQGNHGSSDTNKLQFNKQPSITNVCLDLDFVGGDGTELIVKVHFPTPDPQFLHGPVKYNPETELRRVIHENPGATDELLERYSIDLRKLINTYWITSPATRSVNGTDPKYYEAGRLGTLSRVCKTFAFRQGNHTRHDREALITGMHMAKCVWNVRAALVNAGLLPEGLSTVDMYGMWKYLAYSADDRILKNIGFASLASHCTVVNMSDHIPIPREFNKYPAPVPLYYGVNTQNGAAFFNTDLKKTPQSLSARVTTALARCGQSPPENLVQFHSRGIADFGWDPSAPFKIKRQMTCDENGRHCWERTLHKATDPKKVFRRAKKIPFPLRVNHGKQPIGRRKLHECLLQNTEWLPLAQEISERAKIPLPVTYAYLAHPHARMVGLVATQSCNRSIITQTLSASGLPPNNNNNHTGNNHIEHDSDDSDDDTPLEALFPPKKKPRTTI